MQTITWIRKNDLHVLAVDNNTYTSDLRFTSQVKGDNWTLKIDQVQIRDSGDYECKLSTTPVLKTLVRLNVKG